MTSRRGGPLPENVNTVKRYARGRHVGYYYYYRPNGERINADPADMAAFLKAYEKAKSKAAPTNERSFGALVMAYLASPEFAINSEQEKAHKRLTLDMLREKFDWVEVEDLSDPRAQADLISDFYEWRDSMRHTPALADARVNVLKRLLSWGVQRGRLQVNVAATVKRLVPANHSRRAHIWTPEQEALFLAHADEDMADLFCGALWTVQRQQDAILIDRSKAKDGWLVIKQQKTGAIVHLPLYVFPPLAKLLRRLPAEGVAFRPQRAEKWSRSNVNLCFRNVMRKAGMADVDLTFHDLRGTALTRLAEAGCTEAERAALSGHSLGSKLADYTAPSRELALSAYRKWWAAMRKTAKSPRKGGS